MTPRQAETLKFLEDEAAAGRPTPSFSEIANHLGLRSKSGVVRLLDALEKRGRVTRLDRTARSVRLVRPWVQCPHCKRSFQAKEIQQGGAAAARQAHNLKVESLNLSPAPKSVNGAMR